MKNNAKPYTCKRCRERYGEHDKLKWQQSNHYGWHPSYNECFICFAHSLFGDALGPEVFGDDWEPYPICPHGPPCDVQNVPPEDWFERIYYGNCNVEKPGNHDIPF